MNLSPAISTSIDESPAADFESLFQHIKKPEWGLGLLLWERDGKRGYRFEDGRVRVFKRGFYSFLHEVDAAADRCERLHAAVERTRSQSKPKAAEKVMNAVSIEEQIAYFREQFEGGFAGDKWRRAHRGDSEDERGRRKRHREPTIARAREVLSPESLEQFARGHDWKRAMAEVASVFEQTDLVTAAQRKQFSKIPDADAKMVVSELARLLHGSDPFGIRFEHWIATLSKVLGRPPAWQLATAPLALLVPGEHVPVRPSNFLAQATWMAPRLALGKSPSAPKYERARNMVLRVRARLVEAGLAPRDLLDVCDFMWLTLRPAATKEIRGRRAARRVHVPA